MFANFRRRALAATATAVAAGTILIPNAAAADLSYTIEDTFRGFLWDLLNTLFWIPAGISMELGIFDLLTAISG